DGAPRAVRQPGGDCARPSATGSAGARGAGWRRRAQRHLTAGREARSSSGGWLGDRFASSGRAGTTALERQKPGDPGLLSLDRASRRCLPKALVPMGLDVVRIVGSGLFVGLEGLVPMGLDVL